MKYTLAMLFILFTFPLFAQEEPPLSPEDACIAAEDYWSDDLQQCFVVEDMNDEQILIYRTVQTLLQRKAQLLHEVSDYVTNRTASLASLDNRIANLESKRDAATDSGVQATYQAAIDALEARRDAYVAYNVSNHGQLVSDVSMKIGKHKEELDRLLTQ